MNKNFHAVIIGFNKYREKSMLADLNFAEKDACDLYDLLVDPNYGDCPTENITLITGNRIQIKLNQNLSEYPDRIVALANGEEPASSITTEDIETILYIKAVKDRKKEDIVVVYYSGHGFIAGFDEEAYLATPDILISKINNNPKAGLKMSDLHNDIFIKTKAKFVVFLLDCCNSGAFCPNHETKQDAEEKQLVEGKLFSSGKVAFVSSPRGVSSRESKNFSNGIFTYYLLKGLRGEAKEKTGEVTFNSLVSFVESMSPATQPPIMYGQSTRIVLFSPKGVPNTDQSIYEVKEEHNFSLTEGNVQEIITPLKNPLERSVGFAKLVIDCLGAIVHGDNFLLGNQVLSSIRCALDAEYVFILRIKSDDYDKKKIIPKYQSDLAFKGTDIGDYRDSIISDLYPIMIRKKSAFGFSRYGSLVHANTGKSLNSSLVLIPLRLEYPREFLIICGMDSEKIEYGEIIGRVLTSLYFGTKELTNFNTLDIGAAIWDDIKREFGRVPDFVYKERFEKFKEKLDLIEFYFEPIMYMGKSDFEIDSWEALARDPSTQKSPGDLFKSAELWGTEFITELDLRCLCKAVNSYKSIWEYERGQQKYDPISINVYPETLFRTVYKETLRDILQAKGNQLLRKKIILEISEKRPLPKVEKILERVATEFDPVDSFIKKIGEYKNDLKIGFAIDDFGVGHSSSARLAKLQLAHVKVDRDILLHPYPECTLKYVLDIERASHPQSQYKVVVEGFDGESHINLPSLYDLGIEYIQGHLIRRANPTVKDFSSEERDLIKQLISKNQNVQGELEIE